MLSNNVLIVIPARLKSERLPGKLLLPIHGKPMIYWTYMRAVRAKIADVIVATESVEMEKALSMLDIPFVSTSSECKNGTERVFEVSQFFPDIRFFINVQGDEPLLNPESLRALYLDGLEEDVFKTAISETRERNNPSEVKVALSNDNRIRFASRSLIPYNKNDNQKYFKIHGIYSYSRDVLNTFVQKEPGTLELLESVEQLRCIEHDIPLKGVVTPHTEVSVDTQSDLDKMISKPISLYLSE